MNQLFNIEAEFTVIGSVLLSDKVHAEVFDTLDPSDFYQQRHQVIFEVFKALYNQRKPIDIVVAGEILEQRNDYDENPLEYLAACFDKTPSASNAAEYAKIVKRKSLARKLQGAAAQIHDIAHEPDIDTAIDQAQKLVMGIDRGEDGDCLEVTEVLKRSVERMRDAVERDGHVDISTGYHEIDLLTSGIEGGKFWVIAGRPSMGKTTLALNIARKAMDQGKCVVMFSLEMTADEIGLKLMADKGSLLFSELRSGKVNGRDSVRTVPTIDAIKKYQFHLSEETDLGAAQIRQICRKVAHKTGGIDLVVVDYLGLLRGDPRENRTTQITEISRSLKILARELDCCVMAAVQLNRDCEKRPDKRPMMSDLRDSGGIEQDADVIAMVYRDDVYKLPHEEPDYEAEIIFRKVRAGQTGTAYLRWEGQYQRFANRKLEAVSFGGEA